MAGVTSTNWQASWNRLRSPTDRPLATGQPLVADGTAGLQILDVSDPSAVTPLGASAMQLYALFNAAGEADTDFSGIINFLRGQAGGQK